MTNKYEVALVLSVANGDEAVNALRRAKSEEEKKKMGMMSISAGEGITSIFKDIMVDTIKIAKHIYIGI